MNAHHKRRRRKPLVPELQQQLTTGHFDDADQKTRIHKAITRIPFSRQLNLVLSPAQLDHPLSTRLQQLIAANGSHYHAANINPAQLLEPHFLSSYIRKGGLVALSTDHHDVICIDGRGRLVLALEKDTYELLGIEGRPSRFGSPRQRFIVEINLRDPSFRAGKPGFERIKSKLENWPNSTSIFDQLVGLSAPSSSTATGRQFAMDFVWIDDDGINGEIQFPSGVSATRHTATTDMLLHDGVSLPPILPFHPAPKSSPKSKQKQREISTPTNDEYEEWTEGMLRLRERISLLSLGARGGGENFEDSDDGGDEDEDAEGDSAGIREAHDECSVLALTFTGFFHPILSEKILELISTLNPTPPFLTGFASHPAANSPLSHLSARTPLVGTRKKRNGKTVRRGRGRGEEEEGCGEEIGFEIILQNPAARSGTTGEVDAMDVVQERERVQWAVWEER